MGVLNRNMFNRGGFAHRGTGITSGLDTPRRGLVTGPGGYSGKTEEKLAQEILFGLDNEDNKSKENTQSSLPKFKARDFSTIFKEKQGILQNLRPPTQEFNKFDAATPALMTFFGNLMSGKSFQSGWSGAFDIAGESLTKATPQFSEALASRRAAEAADRKEKFALDLQAFGSAETAHAAEMLREAKAMETKYKTKTTTIDGTGVNEGRLMKQDEYSLDNGVTWNLDGIAYPANESSMVTGSQGTYLDSAGVEFEGYQILIDGNKLVTKKTSGEIVPGESIKQHKFKMGEKVFSVINTSDGKFTGLQIDFGTDEGKEIYNKIINQDKDDTVTIDGEEVDVKDLMITTQNPEFDKKPELGENVFTEYDQNGKATGVQVDLAAESGYGLDGEMSGKEYYELGLKDTTRTFAKLSINAADADSLASQLPKGYNKDLQVTQDAAVLFVQDLLPAYMQSQQENFIPQGTIVGEGFRWINNIKSNIDNFARMYITKDDPNGNPDAQPIFVDEKGEGLQITAEQFLENFKMDKKNRSLVESVSVGGELFNSQIIGLAYSLAKSNNPDGRISEPDFRYALQELKGRTADPSIMGDIMLLQYAKAKNRFKLAWMNQARQHDMPEFVEVNGVKKSLLDQAEEQWLSYSVEANRFEQILAKEDKEKGTNKTEFLATEGKKYTIPLAWDDKQLIEEGKPAMSFIQQWLNSPHPNIEGVTMGDFITGNGFVLSYIDENGISKLLGITK
tara:strand:- start:3898 stop:6102 length:2205 start_codon:yes stop_codon:yes gene_type:complete